jgi:hypothetical protein
MQRFHRDRIKAGVIIAAIIFPCMFITNHCKTQKKKRIEPSKGGITQIVNCIPSLPLYLSIIIILFILSCKTEEEKFSDQQYEEFKSKIIGDPLSVMAEANAEYVSQFHYDTAKRLEAQKWLDKFNKQMSLIIETSEKRKKEIEDRVNKLGGYNIIAIDSKVKCNLYKGYCSLNKSIVDSADLAFIAKYLADQIFQSGKKDPNCDYPLMSQVFIYEPNKYYNGQDNWVATCTISPSNYSGEVYVKNK